MENKENIGGDIGCKMFSQLYKIMLKKYNEQNKLQKQVGLMINQGETQHPIFIDHCMFRNEYVISYLRPFDNGADEINIEQFKNTLSPKLFQLGTFIISGFKRQSNEEPKSSTPVGTTGCSFNEHDGTYISNNSSSPQSLSNNSASDQVNYFAHVPVYCKEVVNCGTIFTATDILCGGKKAFHGKLGLKNEAMVNISELDELTLNEVSFFTSMYSQWVKSCSSQCGNEIPSLLIPIIPEAPKFSNALLLFVEKQSNDCYSLHQLSLNMGCDENVSMQHYFDQINHLTLTLSNLLDVCKKSSAGHFDVSSLWKLHYCFEVVITPAIYLTLSQDCQRTLLNAALDYYSCHDVKTSSPIFCFSLPPFHDSANDIHTNCESRHARLWQRGNISTNKRGCKLSSVLHMETVKKLIFEGGEHQAALLQEILYASENVCTLPRCRSSES